MHYILKTNTERPGYCDDSTLQKIDIRLFRGMESFIEVNDCIVVGEIGKPNAKSDYISKKKGIMIDQLCSDYDFNEGLPLNNGRKYNIIFCFEILEHLQNPLLFLKSLLEYWNNSGFIYLSMPARLRFLWTEHHFHEIPPKHFQKWLLNPLGLEIKRKKRIRINHSPWFYLSGIRPFFRLFFNYTWIYEIKKKK
jgi:hypothetical protein